MESFWNGFDDGASVPLVHESKSKSLHQQIMWVAPKDKHFSGTMALSDRVSLIVITDSDGYKSGMLLVFKELSITLPDATIQYLRQSNKKQEYDKVYCNHPDQKTLCYSIKKENIRKELKQKQMKQQLAWAMVLACIQRRF